MTRTPGATRMFGVSFMVLLLREVVFGLLGLIFPVLLFFQLPLCAPAGRQPQVATCGPICDGRPTTCPDTCLQTSFFVSTPPPVPETSETCATRPVNIDRNAFFQSETEELCFACRKCMERSEE